MNVTCGSVEVLHENYFLIKCKYNQIKLKLLFNDFVRYIVGKASVRFAKLLCKIGRFTIRIGRIKTNAKLRQTLLEK